jgi:hypothetical protein
MLVKVLRGDAISTRRRLAREGNVTFEDLMRATSNFDVRAVTIEDLTSVRHLLPITVGLLLPLWRPCGRPVCPGLMIPVALMEKLDRYPMRAYPNPP